MIENIFICEPCDVLTTSAQKDEKCEACGKSMTNIGFMETANDVGGGKESTDS